MERMVEAIRKGYWDAGEETRRKLAERWQELAADHGVDIGEALTREFVTRMVAGFGFAAAPETPDAEAAAANAPQPVVGQVLEEVAPADIAPDEWRLWLAMSAMLCLVALGGGLQWRENSRCA